MKTTKININRVFTKTSSIIRDGLIRLEGEKSLSSVLNSVGGKFVVLSLGSSTKATSRIRLYHKFSRYILVLTKRHGAEFTVKYLKACNLAISKFLAGQPMKSLREIEKDLPLPRLSKSGLPAIIGTRDRRSLHACSHKVIRLGLTLFSLYRIIVIPSKAKLNTITDPFSGNLKFLEIVENWMEFKTPAILQRFRKRLVLEKNDIFSMTESASPSNSKSGLGMLTDISLLKNHPALLESLIVIMEFTVSDRLRKIFINLSKLLPSVHSPKFENMRIKTRIFELLFEYNMTFSQFMFNNKHFGLGQLQMKAEAAGKMRVFAMVDSGTQTVLLPLHTYITKLLKQFGNDGTDSHQLAFERVMLRSKQYGCSYGYDLSAATDRLPMSIQIKLMTALFGKDFAKHGANILIGRPYYLIEKSKRDKISKISKLEYAVGQPMGARSSFTMLGLTHHMLVQFASSQINAGLKGENRYEIVGDDIVIFNKDLATSYLNVMTLIGVPINESKSVIAENRPVAEFVKRLSVNGKDVSAFSGKQFINQDTFLGRISTFIGLVQKEKDNLSKSPMSVFNTIMKEKIFDTRIYSDSLGYLSLYFTYVIKSNMRFENLIRSLYMLSPKLEEKKLVFSKFDFHEIGRKIKQMILTNSPPVDATSTPFSGFGLSMRKVVDINEYMAKIYFDLSINIRSKLGSLMQPRKRAIIQNIFGYFDLKDQISKDIGDELELWISKQDPLFYDRRHLELCEDLQFLTNHYRTIDELEISRRLFEDMSGSLSFLNIVERLDEKKTEEIFSNPDPSILRDFTKALQLIEKGKRKVQVRRPMVRPEFSRLENLGDGKKG